MAQDTMSDPPDSDEPVEPTQDSKKNQSVSPTGWDPYSPPPSDGSS